MRRQGVDALPWRELVGFREFAIYDLRFAIAFSHLGI